MIKLFKAKSLKSNTKTENISLNERTQEKEKSKGRSMVEMLGVLAIIGVLSIGGIQGYTIAMRRYQANEILNVANKYALSIWTYMQRKMEEDPNVYKWLVFGQDSELEDGLTTYGKGLYLPFTDSGLGPLPNGLTRIGTRTYERAISKGKSGTAVSLVLYFKDKNLCEVVKSAGNFDTNYAFIGGRTGDFDCSQSVDWEEYEGTGAKGYPLHLSFYQE